MMKVKYKMYAVVNEDVICLGGLKPIIKGWYSLPYHMPLMYHRKDVLIKYLKDAKLNWAIKMIKPVEVYWHKKRKSRS